MEICNLVFLVTVEIWMSESIDVLINEIVWPFEWPLHFRDVEDFSVIQMTWINEADLQIVVRLFDGLIEYIIW
jgi:hypothetical protein